MDTWLVEVFDFLTVSLIVWSCISHLTVLSAVLFICVNKRKEKIIKEVETPIPEKELSEGFATPPKKLPEPPPVEDNPTVLPADASSMFTDVVDGSSIHGKTTTVKETLNEKSVDTNTEKNTVKSSVTSRIQPREFVLDSKQMRIAMGFEERSKSDYPTLADVVSDWDSKTNTVKDEEHRCHDKEHHSRDTQEDTNSDKAVVGPRKRKEIGAVKTGSQNTQSPSKASSPATPGKAASPRGTKASGAPNTAVGRETDDGGSQVSGTRSPEGKILSVDPPEAYFPAKGGAIKHKLINHIPIRLAFKMKCSNNEHYRMQPVYGFVEALGRTYVELQRYEGPPRRDRVNVYYKEAPMKATDAKAVFAQGVPLGRFEMTVIAR